MEIFAERLKELRIEKNLNQRELAKQIGYSQAAITRWENNIKIPNIVALKAIAMFFGVTSDYLIGLEN